ncbi:hypothetical protein DJ60_957 [Yersinia enterocolitica]|uniref:hypothetical protein n=1 Tax=Yersinia enterocolitica TaxID=630 RepID=UPI0005032FDE|nr:hypothetical protein [Yersinia enterocolitica]KGA78774.1 hypothetical protein DJ60_957 [Yersinia enterocolitica]
MSKHPNKHIQAAIEYALKAGWVLVPPGDSAHCFCKLRCGDPKGEHRDHHQSVWSTPKVPENHAQQIRRAVDKCTRIKCLKSEKS